MFVLLRGELELIAERDELEHSEGTIAPGGFLGEKALVRQTPYQRYFSARAKLDSTVLELSLKDVERLETEDPVLTADLLKRLFQRASDRLAKNSYLIRILRYGDPLQRVLELVRYFCRTSGTRTTEGVEIELSSESILFYVEMEKHEADAILSDLVTRELILKRSETRYLVPDDNELFSDKTIKT